MIVLDPAALQALVAQRQGHFPREAVGLLLGSTDRTVIEAILPLENCAGDCQSFSIAPAELWRGICAAQASSRQVIGLYHTHSWHDSRPSSQDLDHFRDPDWFYLIAGCGLEPSCLDLRCYRFRNAGLEEVLLRNAGRAFPETTGHTRVRRPSRRPPIPPVVLPQTDRKPV